MFNKKTKIIILLIILFLTIIVILIFKNKKMITDENQLIDDKSFNNLISELKNNYPEFNESQLKFYQQEAIKAKNSNAEFCLNMDDKNCVAVVAFIKNNRNLCHDLDEHKEQESVSEHAEHGEEYKKCINDITNKIAATEIDQCQTFTDDAFFNCIRAIFNVKTYNKPEDCVNISNKDARLICEEIFNYEAAYLQYDRSLCKKIQNEKLNQYCLKNIIDKFQDSDKDGLSDLDEINIYKTSHNNPDSDKDGYLDGEEVKNGHNPLGQ